MKTKEGKEKRVYDKFPSPILKRTPHRLCCVCVMSSESSDSAAACAYMTALDYPGVKSVDVLTDGVFLFQTMASVDAQHFPTSSLTHNCSQSWPLKLSNLKKLKSNLEDYLSSVLHLDASEALSNVDLTAVARDDSVAGIVSLFEIVLAALISCDQKERFIKAIMSLGGEDQAALKSMIERAMKGLTKIDLASMASGDQGGGDGEEITFGDDSGEAEGLRQECEDLRKLLAEASAERDDLKKQLEEDDSEAQNDKLKVLVHDLQNRLEEMELEVNSSQKRLTESKQQAMTAQDLAVTTKQQNQSLQDEIDILQSKTLRLDKAEATIEKYKKKLEEAAGLRNHVQELEDKNAKYLDQVLELEDNLKNAGTYKVQIEEYKEKVTKAEREKFELSTSLEAKTEESKKFKAELSSEIASKKLLQDELNRARIDEGRKESLGADDEFGGLSFEGGGNMELKEKITRLEFENKKLLEQIETAKAGAVTGTDLEDALRNVKEREAMLRAKDAEVTESMTVLEAEKKRVISLTEILKDKDSELSKSAKALEVEKASTNSLESAMEEERKKGESLSEALSKLTSAVKNKDETIAKLTSDNNKLETYTKQTLNKFQDKYLIALQDCKRKLQEERSKREALEVRMAKDKAAQRRESSIISSSLYELGLDMLRKDMAE